MSAVAAPTALRLGERQLGDVEMLRVGGYAPLTGFMTRADYARVVDEMHLADGAPVFGGFLTRGFQMVTRYPDPLTWHGKP